MNTGILVCELGNMKVDARGRDVVELQRQEKRAQELSGPVTVRKMTPEEREKYGLAPEVEK